MNSKLGFYEDSMQNHGIWGIFHKKEKSRGRLWRQYLKLFYLYKDVIRFTFNLLLICDT